MYFLFFFFFGVCIFYVWCVVNMGFWSGEHVIMHGICIVCVVHVWIGS